MFKVGEAQLSTPVLRRVTLSQFFLADAFTSVLQLWECDSESVKEACQACRDVSGPGQNPLLFCIPWHWWVDRLLLLSLLYTLPGKEEFLGCAELHQR
jgi:hypothetical protein